MKTTTLTPELNILLEAIKAELQADFQGKLNAAYAEIENLKAQLAYFKRRQFGSISERADADMRQLSLFCNLSDETGKAVSLPEPPQIELEIIQYTRKKRKGKREEDLSSLPIRQIVYELPEDERGCPTCEAPMKDSGTTTRREIEIIPATAVVTEHITHSYACNNPMCAGTLPKNPNDNDEESQDPSGNDQGGDQVVVIAPAPTPLFQGSLASPSFVAHIAYQKYSNGMPLYRLEKGFWYDGVSISRQTMSNWVIKCSELYLVSIYARMIYYLLLETVAHSDWTGVQVLNEPGRDATTKSHVWVHRTTGLGRHNRDDCATTASMLPKENGELGRSIIIYEYTQTKAHYNPEGFFSGADGGVSKGLGNFTGHLHVDGDKAYKSMKQVAKPLDSSKSEIILVGCWAHARRPFENILKPLTKEQKQKHSATTGFSLIQALFALEKQFDKADLTPDKRHFARHNSTNNPHKKTAKQLADSFFEWAYQESLEVVPESTYGKALNYALNQKENLLNVFLDGRLELSNNRCERSVKPFVMGRKAWLFANTPEGATASCIIYSIIETAKENGLHPYHYIKYLLETLPTTSTANIDQLLPWSKTLPDSCYAPLKV